MIKLIITDDHFLTREGLKNRLRKDMIDVEIIGEASTGSELLKLLRDKKPDIVLLDISLPDKNGLELLKEIKIQFPNVEVIVLSMHPEERYAIRAYKAGAIGYLSKDNESLGKELVNAIRTTFLHKKRYVSERTASKLADYIYDSRENKHQNLSDREFQVVCMIAAGKKTSQIAEELNVTIQTVYTYRNRAKEKLGLETDADFTKYALQYNLID